MLCAGTKLRAGDEVYFGKIPYRRVLMKVEADNGERCLLRDITGHLYDVTKQHVFTEQIENDTELKMINKELADIVEAKQKQIDELKEELEETDSENNIINNVWCELYNMFPDLADKIASVWLKYYGDKPGKTNTQIIGELKTEIRNLRRLYQMTEEKLKNCERQIRLKDGIITKVYNKEISWTKNT